jgi:hypothetical protein
MLAQDMRAREEAAARVAATSGREDALQAALDRLLQVRWVSIIALKLGSPGIALGRQCATPLVTVWLEQELADCKDLLADAQARNAVLEADNSTANRLLEESKVRAGFEQLVGRLLVSIFHFLCFGVPLYMGEWLR